MTANEYENVTEQDACQWRKQRNFEHGGGTVGDLRVLLFAGCIKRVLSYAFGYKATNTTMRMPIQIAVRGDTIDDATG